MEGRVESQGNDVSKGLSAVEGDVKALSEEHAQGMRRLSQLEAGRDGQDGVRRAAGEEDRVAAGVSRSRDP